MSMRADELVAFCEIYLPQSLESFSRHLKDPVVRAEAKCKTLAITLGTCIRQRNDRSVGL